MIRWNYGIERFFKFRSLKLLACPASPKFPPVFLKGNVVFNKLIQINAEYSLIIESFIGSHSELVMDFSIDLSTHYFKWKVFFSRKRNRQTFSFKSGGISEDTSSYFRTLAEKGRV